MSGGTASSLVIARSEATKQSSAERHNWIASSGCALLAMTPRSVARRLSRLLDVPEHRLAFQHAGDVLAEAGERDRLAKRDVRHVLEGLKLDRGADLLLLVEIVSREPRAA